MRKFLPLALLALIGLTFTACDPVSSDEDELIGTWRATGASTLSRDTLWLTFGNNYRFLMRRHTRSCATGSCWEYRDVWMDGQGKWMSYGDELRLSYTYTANVDSSGSVSYYRGSAADTSYYEAGSSTLSLIYRTEDADGYYGYDTVQYIRQ